MCDDLGIVAGSCSLAHVVLLHLLMRYYSVTCEQVLPFFDKLTRRERTKNGKALTTSRYSQFVK